MADITEIKIPENLLPKDGRFGAGPSKVRPEQIDELSKVSKSYLGTSHRQKTVKNEVARFIERLKLEPIILHEQPNSGDTIIEKIDRNTDVGFGVVLSAVAVKPPTSGGGYKAT